MVLNLF